MILQILIISSKNDPPWHYYEDYEKELEKILGEEGYQINTVHDLEIVKQQGGLGDYQAIIFCGRFGDRDDEAERELERFVHSGKGLVIIHISSSSFEFSLRWRKLIGRVWEYGGPPPFTSSHPEPPGPFTVNIITKQHPVTKGLNDFKLEHDERYQDLLVSPDAKIYDLATATLEERTESVAWVLTPPEGGRVFHTSLGHDLSTYKNKGFQSLLINGVAWAAGSLH